MTEHDRIAATAFEALAYELADATQRLCVQHTAARGLAHDPGLDQDYALAVDQARGSLFAALSSLEQAADTMLTGMALGRYPGDTGDAEDCTLGRPIVTAELPVDGPL